MPDEAIVEIARRLRTLNSGDLTASAVGGQSLNNSLWRIDTADGAFALRIPHRQGPLGIDRAAELVALRAAAAAGVSPAVIESDGHGVVLFEWIDGREWTHQDLERQGSLERVLELVRRAQVPAPPGLRRFRDIVHTMASRANDAGAPISSALVRHLDQFDSAETHCERRRPDVLTHHDVWPNNVLESADRLWLVDWEFAGAGDGMTDLATVALSTKMTFDGVAAGEADNLLAAGGRAGERDRLSRAMWEVQLFEAVWASAMHASEGSAGTFDYKAHADAMTAALDEAPGRR